jgi:hypothetical protein
MLYDPLAILGSVVTGYSAEETPGNLNRKGFIQDSKVLLRVDILRR